MLEFLELLGFETITFVKKILSWEYKSVTSLPLNIFATNVPPDFNIWVVIFSAANSSWACIYSSISWMPVTKIK